MSFFDYLRSNLPEHKLTEKTSLKSVRKYNKVNQTFDQPFINDQEDQIANDQARRLYHIESQSMVKEGGNPYLMA